MRERKKWEYKVQPYLNQLDADRLTDAFNQYGLQDKNGRDKNGTISRRYICRQ